MKQTAVKWLYDQLEFDDSISMDDIEKIFEQAKAMEKEQIEIAHTCGGYGEKEAEQYYNRTFKSE
jgi:hypothetical protein